MLRITFYFTTALITFMAGAAVTRAWNWLGNKDVSYVSAPASEPGFAPDTSVSPVEQELLEIEHQYDIAQTRHDAAFFEKLGTDSYIFIDEDGKAYTKTQAIALMKTFDPNIKYSSHDLHVQLYGNVAIVSGWTTATGGSEEDSECQWIDLFVNREGRWQTLSTTLVN